MANTDHAVLRAILDVRERTGYPVVDAADITRETGLTDVAIQESLRSLDSKGCFSTKSFGNDRIDAVVLVD